MAAPEASRLVKIVPRKSTAPSATDFTGEADQIDQTSCQSKTSAYSCYLMTQDACKMAATDRQKLGGGLAHNGTCVAHVILNHAANLSFADCTKTFQTITNGCVTPGERPNPHDTLPTMPGWQNADPGNPSDASGGCGSYLDANKPSFELASGNCISKYGTNCGGGSNFGGKHDGSGGGNGAGGTEAARSRGSAGGVENSGNIDPQ